MAIKPVVLTVDDDMPVLRAVERDPRKQWGQLYRIAVTIPPAGRL